MRLKIKVINKSRSLLSGWWAGFGSGSWLHTIFRLWSHQFGAVRAIGCYAFCRRAKRSGFPSLRGTMETQRNITDLPFEVLDLIFKKLPKEKDKLNLGQTHEVLGNAFAYHVRDRYRIFQMNASFTEDTNRFILRTCGSTIVEFRVCPSVWDKLDEFVKLVSEHENLKLEILSAHVWARTENSIRSILHNAKSSLKFCKLRIECSDKIVDALEELQELRTLIYCKETPFLSDDVYQIQKLVNLEHLTIQSSCLYFPYPIDLLEICAPLKNLRSLRVYSMMVIPNVEAALLPWPSLETLIMERCPIATCLPPCPKIKSLKIQSDCKCSIPNSVYAFLLDHASTLERVKLECDPDPFDGDGLLEVLRCCKKLRIFRSPMRHTKIYLGFVDSMLNILKENGFTRDDPFRLVIRDRAKYKWMKRLMPRTLHPEVIDLDYAYDEE